MTILAMFQALEAPMFSHPIARLALRIVPVVTLAALAGCVAVPVGPGPGYGYGPGPAYYPAPVVVVPAYRPYGPPPFRPWR